MVDCVEEGLRVRPMSRHNMKLETKISSQEGCFLSLFFFFFLIDTKEALSWSEHQLHLYILVCLNDPHLYFEKW